VWFDNPESLAAKYKVASDNGLAGIGFWNLDCLDYGSSDSVVQQQTAAMWAAVKQAVAGWKQAGADSGLSVQAQKTGGSEGMHEAI
jgi:GH18 family chitinase